MSRNLDSIFPDVFSYPQSRQEIQLSSLYEKPRTQPKSSLKQVQYPHAFGHTNPTISLKSHAQDATNTSITPVVGPSTAAGTTGTIPVNNTSVVLPPMRRLIKFPVSSTYTSFMVVTFSIINTLLCVVIPITTTPLMGTLWGSFLHIWVLVTIMQTISHSVYMCTPTAMICTMVHLCVVVISAIVVPISLFAEWLWLAPCLCTVIVVHQVQLICLVYSHVPKQWMYAVSASVLVFLPMIQLIQINAEREDTMFTSFVWSIISIYTLYGFAIANNKGAVLVDVTIGASPTWQLQE